MNINHMLKSLFKTKTIAPTYKLAHVIYTLLLLGTHPKGIGRYRIRKTIQIGEGTVKTMLARMKEEELITVEKTKQKGHKLTQKGKNLYKLITERISHPLPLENNQNTYVIGKKAYYSRVNAQYLKKQQKIGIQQRDEAIKIGGQGATCLIYDGETFYFPEDKEKQKTTLDPPIQKKQFKENDILVIGGGENETKAILATLTAAASLIDWNL